MLNAVRYGILFALAIFLWAVTETMLGLHDRHIRYHEYLSYFFAVPSVGIMYWGVYAGQKKPAAGMSFRGAFLKGLGITAVVSVLCPVVWYVFCVYVNPDFLGNMARHAVDTKEMAPPLAAKRFSLPGHLLVSTLSTAVIGAGVSLVIAVIVARRKGLKTNFVT